MPHAEASNFDTSITKSEGYASVQTSLKGLLEDQTNWVCNLANTSSLLWHLFHALPGPLSKVNWAGFYVVDPKNPGQLILGPFQGKVACQTIKFGKGVCGEAAAKGVTLRIDDVENWPGHIACDGDSRSEIVVPLIFREKVVGVLDIDCTELNGFDQEDQENLEAVAKQLVAGSEWL